MIAAAANAVLGVVTTTASSTPSASAATGSPRPARLGLEPRGLGLMIGFDLADAQTWRGACSQRRLVVHATGPETIRMLPPLTVSEARSTRPWPGSKRAPHWVRRDGRRRHTLIKTASYEAEPGEVGRVLLLYSGGLDTSVMLKWIQDEYEAEVVALTVNLGQPGEDYEVVKGKALHLGALDCHVVDARGVRARLRAAGDQGERALRRRLSAVHRARPAADREAGGRVRAEERLRHDRPRLHRQGQRPGADRVDRDRARPGHEDHRAGARLADGPRGGDRLRARARHPGEGRHRDARPTRSTTTSGAARPRARSRTSRSRRATTSSTS